MHDMHDQLAHADDSLELLKNNLKIINIDINDLHQAENSGYNSH